MRKKIQNFLIIFFVVLVLSGFNFQIRQAKADNILNGEWIPSTQEMETGLISNHFLLQDSQGDLYVVFEDKQETLGTYGKVYVKKFNGQTWEDYDRAGGIFCSLIGAEISTTDEINIGCAFMSEETGEEYAFVRSLSSNLTNWDSVGSTVPGRLIQDLKFFLDKNNVPYLSLKDFDGNIKIRRYLNGEWQLINNTFRVHSNYDIAFDSNNNLYLGFDNIENKNNLLKVFKYADSSWQDLNFDGPMSTTYYDLDLAIDQNRLLVLHSYRDGVLTPFSIKEYINSSWVSLSLPAGLCGSADINFFDGTMYIAHQDTENGRRIVASRYNDNENIWDRLGISVSVGLEYYPSIIVNNGTIFIAYSERDNGNKLMIKSFTQTPAVYYSGSLVESSTNDGSVSGDLTANIVLGNFVNAGGTLTEGVHFSVVNKPRGLGLVSMEVSDAGTSSRVLVAGKSFRHASRNSLNNFSILFNDSAFSGLMSSEVSNSSFNRIKIAFMDKPYILSQELVSPGTIFSPASTGSGFLESDSLKMTKSSNGDIFIAYADDSSSLAVKKYNGNNWDVIGSWNNLQDGGKADDVSSVFISSDENNNIFLAYNFPSYSDSLNVKYFNGDDWSDISNAPTCSLQNMFYNDGSLFVACVGQGAEREYIEVYEYDKDQNNWQVKGDIFSSIITAFNLAEECGWGICNDGDIYFPSFGVDNNHRLYALVERSVPAGGEEVRMIIYENNSWQLAPDFLVDLSGSSAEEVLVVDEDNNFYLIYYFLGTEGENQLYIKKLINNSWVDINNSPFSEVGGVIKFDAKVIGGSIYVLYNDSVNNNRAQLVKIDNDGVLEVVGLGYFSDDSVNEPSLLVNNEGNPVVMYFNDSEEVKLRVFYKTPVISRVMATTKDNDVNLSWSVEEGEDNIDNYLIQYRSINNFNEDGDADWEVAYQGTPEENSVLIENLESGLYKAEVIAIDQFGLNSQPAETFITINSLISPEGIGDLAVAGIITPTSGTATNTEAIRFNQRTIISLSSGPSVVIPTGVVMTASTTFQVIDLVAEAADVSDLEDINPAGALKFGLPSLGLTLSEPITINIPVSGFSDGQELKVYRKSIGSSWSELTSCSVLSNVCSFQTNHLSEFAAGLSTSPSSDSTTPSIPSITNSLPVVTTCSQVVYGEFSSTCFNGYQYRDFISQTPAGCSLTAAQIEGARRACSSENINEKENNKGVVDKNTNSFEKKNSITEFINQEKQLVKTVNASLAKRLTGRILLQVEERGEAWYVNPLNGAKYFLGGPSDAFSLMKKMALGINNKTFQSFKNGIATNKLAGRILLNVEENGKAYYVDPLSLKLYYLGRPDDAFNIMRSVGLGIKNENLRQIKVEEIN